MLHDAERNLPLEGAARHLDITLAIRMDQDNREALDYYLLPRIDISQPRLHLTEENGFMVDTYRCESIQGFYALASRTQIRTAA
jgi:hypothetical protein